MTTTSELRQRYLEFFRDKHDHAFVPSSPIVPPDDPTMLFTSAGMVQFKGLYAGTVDPLPYTRATTCQKCMRAGGKGSDLENVGKTLRHHTFFEMLGNFSFGDYFKREALEWGWDFIWNEMKLPKERMWATIFEEDDETEAILETELGFPLDRIIRLDAKENFWGPAGETGACGPCSEIIFFTGTAKELEAAGKQSRAVIARRIVEEGDLFLEIWNMVFPQFDQQPDGSRRPLKNRGIDTGAGLERMTTVMQFVESGGRIRSPYDTDLIRPIVEAAAGLLGVSLDEANLPERERDPRRRFWVNAVSDHARALTFALSEGLTPSNEGRGYVLRRILRRALRFGCLLEVEKPFLCELVDPVVEVMGGTYPEIKKSAAHTAQVIRLEEERFLRTVAQGTAILDEKIVEAKERGEEALRGEDVFLLHATYGYPVDMTAEVAGEAGLKIDRESFQTAMRAHQEEARKSWKGGGGKDLDQPLEPVAEKHGETEFVGYEMLEATSRVLAILKDGGLVDSLAEGDEAALVLETTPFYAESGGQVGDAGVIEAEGFRFRVTDARKTTKGLVAHLGRVEGGEIACDSPATARVDGARRLAVMRNHTVTHLLQAALRRVLGPHVAQSGSWVGPENMRFDFTNMQACTGEQLREVERTVNRLILADHPVQIEEMGIEDARKKGAIAPFGEKYGHRVRVVQVGRDGDAVSMEFCGGTHMDRTAGIGSFRLLAESSVASGVRRIEGATGEGAYESWAGTRDVAAALAAQLAVKEEQLGERVGALQEEIKRLNKEIKRAKQAKPAASPEALLADAPEIDGLKIVAAKIDEADPEVLRALADQIRDRADQAVVVLGATDGEKVLLVCAVTKNATGRVKAGDVIKRVAKIVGGGGGGRPDLAQAGGKNPEKLGEAVSEATNIVRELLGA